MAMLRKAGLRATRPRMALGSLLFTGVHQHVSADELHQRATAAGIRLSLATVYNSLHQFRDAGLLRDVTVDAASSYFDTDTSDHHHFFDEDERRVFDIPAGSISLQGLPQPPDGWEVTHVDVVVRLRRIGSSPKSPARGAGGAAGAAMPPVGKA